jgi:hypothetical protein
VLLYSFACDLQDPKESRDDRRYPRKTKTVQNRFACVNPFPRNASPPALALLGDDLRLDANGAARRVDDERVKSPVRDVRRLLNGLVGTAPTTSASCHPPRHPSRDRARRWSPPRRRPSTTRSPRTPTSRTKRSEQRRDHLAGNLGAAGRVQARRSLPLPAGGFGEERHRSPQTRRTARGSRPKATTLRP